MTSAALVGLPMVGLALVGAPIRLPSVQLEPPAGFVLQTDVPFVRDTAALAPVAGDSADPPRRLEAFFVEELDGGLADGGQPATFSVSSVDAPLSFDTSPSPIIASAAMAHLHRHLDIEASLDWVSTRDKPAPGASPRVEVWARARIDGAPTSVLLAFVPGPQTYAVAVASLPAGRTAELTPRVEASLDTIQVHVHAARLAPERWLSVLVWGAAGLAVVGWQVIRRLRR